MNDPENKLDNLLRDHLSRELDAHVGRSQKAFEAELSRVESSRRLPIRYWAAAATVLISISLVGALLLRNFLRPPPQPKPQLVSEEPPLMPIAQTIDWHTVDDGTVMLNGDMPVRRLRRQVVERIKWYDPKRKTTVELAVPQEQVMFIGMADQARFPEIP
jgi:hypothetical protein